MWGQSLYYAPRLWYLSIAGHTKENKKQNRHFAFGKNETLNLLPPNGIIILFMTYVSIERLGDFGWTRGAFGKKMQKIFLQ